MSDRYVAVQWNRQKRCYDATLAGAVFLFLTLFIAASKALFPLLTDEILLLRAFGAAAFVLLHVILCIGPLCRLDPRFLPLLYNRRHAGVTCFLLGLIHAVLVIITYHAGGDINPFVNIFTSTPLRPSPDSLPFQAFGFAALFILLLMAATSHDFWLANLTAPVWKTLHMAVYGAYGLLVMHVAFGVLQAETSPVLLLSTAAGFCAVIGFHLAAASRERKIDTRTPQESAPNPAQQPDAEPDGFVEACAVSEIPENRARIVCLSGERVAIFKYEGKVSAVSNVCQHQNGPLGEGKIVYGCITCPWHGYQYNPEDGASPPPFTEKVPTFRVRIRRGRVFVHPDPLPAGTRTEPARIDSAMEPATAPRSGLRHEPGRSGGPQRMKDEFYIGWQDRAPAALSRRVRTLVGALALLVAGGSLMLAFSQRLAGRATFQWRDEREFTGILETDPVPHLVERTVAGVETRHLLVAPWKFGFDRDLAGAFAGQAVRLKGKIIQRDNQHMIEVRPGSVEAAPPLNAPPPTAASTGSHPLGIRTLRGEIVDSKCWLGVMNPGRLATHRACAVRCLSGGIPPILLVQYDDGRTEHYLLVGADGRAINREILDLVAEPVEITGEVLRRGDLLTLQAEPGAVRRLERAR